MIAGAYLRKSNDQSDTSADVKSVTVQKALIAAFAAKRGFTLDERFIYSDDGVSGAAFRERPGLQALLAALNPAPPFQVLLVTEQSRLGRDTVRMLAVI